jgi:hypothetical protein
VAYGWVHQAAAILGMGDAGGVTVQRRLGGLLGVMTRRREAAGELSGAVDHFVKVTRSYWPGLFHCYAVAELPRTNNALEQLFGSHRYHERRATGRKAASPALVLRGAAKVLAGTASRRRAYAAAELAKADRGRWAELRRELEERRQRRVVRCRFRRDPKAFLRQLEEQLNQSGLPA